MHWLNYSHADQALLRDDGLDQAWDGLVVPGTLATYYRAGTGGFVLSRGRPYVIDPRTPLLQAMTLHRSEPRKSHLTLAAIHDASVPGFWPEREIELSFWQDGRWPTVVSDVINYQLRYKSNADDKVDKYAELLRQATGRTLAVEAQGPQRIIPPYWAVTGTADPWWDLSREAIEIAVQRPDPVMPVLTLTRDTPVTTFTDLLDQLPSNCANVFAWRGDWKEADATQDDVSGWVETVQRARGLGIRVTNLYGGYLSVLLTGLGLHGLSHGIGYSESRDVRRLGATGAPPTRYYVSALHDFVPRADAQPVIDTLPAEWACDCAVCSSVIVGGRPVIDTLGVEDLKRHFLLCRARELERVASDLDRALAQLDDVSEWLGGRDLAGLRLEPYERRLADWSSWIGEYL